MQQLQHKQFTTVHTSMQVCHEQTSLPIRYCYVLAGIGFAVIDSLNKNDRKKPWFER